MPIWLGKLSQPYRHIVWEGHDEEHDEEHDEDIFARGKVGKSEEFEEN
jgi:hypothetical protein